MPRRLNQNCSDPLRRSAANTRLLAAGALTRLTVLFLMKCIGAFRRCSLTFATLVRSCGSAADIEGAEIPRCSCWVLCAHGQVTTIELNEPVAPEFRDILPDELFQTVEKLFRSSRHVFRHARLSLSTCHAFDTPRLLNQRELLGSAGTMGQPHT